MEASVASLPRSDGVACFTRLYLDVTKGVQKELAGITFGDPRFLAQLDIAFANLFFSAMDGAAHKPVSVPRAWAPLVEARGARGIAPLQFALAGMSAHINRDLPSRSSRPAATRVSRSRRARRSTPTTCT